MDPSARKIDEQQRRYLLFLARLYAQNGKPDKAIIIYEALWHLLPEAENLGFCLGYLHLKANRLDRALFYIDSYLKKKTSSTAFLLKAQILFKLGREQEARDATRHFLAL